ncbi:Hepatocyte growth factor receptor [Frankliniella fusca]|uniref:Hepatocyte growth factor receptor n=1 Tax=Frankliniella fusca TaxID=407009 RepID=A0AAE1HF01_9NEOP|nr:Hepatocyte growth factor receptor [Frankliniella fusca]KAK3920052.1 Hepatocyte growth factor receptor [Frankliniella fusca]
MDRRQALGVGDELRATVAAWLACRAAPRPHRAVVVGCDQLSTCCRGFNWHRGALKLMVDVALSHLSLVLHVKWNEAVEYICIRIVMKPIKIY